MITILEGCVQTVWMPIKPSATVYVGSLVSVDMSALDEGVVVRPTAVGVANITNKDRPLGVCIGTNRREPVFSSTYLAEYITDEGVTGLRTSTTDYVGVEGAWGKGDKRAMVQVALIGPQTVLRAPLRNNSIATAITEETSSTGNANGLTMTTAAAIDFTPVANLCTCYCRVGLNAGTYRIMDTTSTTVHAWDVQMLNTTATAGETYVFAPVRHHGISYVTIGDGTVASYINTSVSPATNYDIIHVINCNMETAGNEYVDFMFDTTAFSSVDYNVS